VANKFIIEVIGEDVIKLSTPNNGVVRIEKIIYAPDCDFNLILLGQLSKTGITYHNKKSHITLKKNRTIITRASAVKNMFLFNVIVSTTLTIKKKPNILRKTIKQKDI